MSTQELLWPGLHVSILVNLDNYEIIVLVVGYCSLYDRQGKRLTTPSHMTEKLTELVEIAKGKNRKVVVAEILSKAVRCDVEYGLVRRKTVVHLTRHTGLDCNRQARRTNSKMATFALVEWNGTFVNHDRDIHRLARRHGNIPHDADYVHLTDTVYGKDKLFVTFKYWIYFSFFHIRHILE